ncbi:MAG: ABC transporter ATP-binding protein [Phototrophicaceae bacterium]
MMPALLTTHDLTVGYRTRNQTITPIASHLNLALHQGEMVCLMGANGVGKSTLMRTLATMQKPIHGKITLDGQDVSKLPAPALATRLSVVFTDRPELGLMNGYALVALGRHPHTDWTGRLTTHDEDIIRWAVGAVGANAFAHRAVMELSDGQRQKLMIARALAQESAVILLDEPTAFLDLPRRVELMQTLQEVAHTTQRAILLSTHDLDLALRSADRLWLLTERGVRVGIPEELILNGAFASAFHSEGVEFDYASGSFAMAHPKHGVIGLMGEGIEANWTAHALRRVGYTVSMLPFQSSTPDLIVQIKATEQGMIWLLTHRHHTTIYPTLETLLQQVILLQDKASSLVNQEVA